MKVFIKRAVFLTLCIALLNLVQAQQDPMYTQYMFNTLSINPAYAGSRGALNATGLYRSQWVGLDGAPVTKTFTIHSPLPLNMGLGVSLVNDKIGPISTNYLFIDYSYTIKVTESSKLAFGLKAGFSMTNGGLTKLDLGGGADNLYEKDLKSPMLPNFGFGIYYHSDKWYLGISTPKLLENDYFDNKEVTSAAAEERHYFLIGGVVFDINEFIKFKPTMLLKYVAGAPIQGDVSANVLFYEKLWIGAAYRHKESVSGLFGLRITDQLSLGYSYDYSLSELSSFNSGTHEIMLSYDLVFKKRQTLSPRYF